MSTEAVAQEHLDHHHEEDAKSSWMGGKSPFNSSYGKLMMWYFLLSDAFTFAGFLITYGALRFSSPNWPVPDFVFRSIPFPGVDVKIPLAFVTLMTFILIISSATMVRAVQEGHRENKRGAAKWLLYTIIGGAMFLGCQALEWTELIVHEHVTPTKNPFASYTQSGTYVTGDSHMGIEAGDAFKKGESYIIHKVPGTDDVTGESKMVWHPLKIQYEGSNQVIDQPFGPRAFGALFFFITGFHGFHVFSGVVFLIIILINVMGGVYVKRRNGYEMVEKVGLYWHFVDLVWVFVFLVFYLI